MDDGEDDRDVEMLGRRAGKARAIEAFAFQPIDIKPAAAMGGFRPASRRVALMLLEVEPRSRLFERRCHQAIGIIVAALLLFPHIEIGLVAMSENEIDVA